MMTPVWTVAESRARDAEATAAGVPFLSLMERAGGFVAEAVRRRPGTRRVLILAGPGANGGDGLVAARLLARQMPVTLCVPGRFPGFLGAAELLRAAQAYGADVVTAEDGLRALETADLVVDGLLGTGFRGEWGEVPGREILERTADRGIPVYAIDILSGVAADTGEYGGPPVPVEATITFGAPKWGHFGHPGALRTGRLLVADIGLAGGAAGGRWMHPDLAAASLRPPDRLGSKFGRGRVIVLGGSAAMPGAPVMAGYAALRAGAGLVELLVPASLAGRLGAPAPLIVHPGGETREQTLSPSESDWRRVARASALVVGPGLGRRIPPGFLDRVLGLGLPTVLDADGLGLLARYPRRVGRHVVLTPHSGEMARLLQRTVPAVDGNRRQALLDAVERYDAGVVLKGAFTLSGAGETVTVNTSGGPELATAGTGDVLAGIVAAFLAASLPSAQAMALGAYLHGWAGTHAADRQSRAVTALDVIDSLGAAWKSLQQKDWPAGAPRQVSA
ncbi:MAG: NAD(P)H-hydrate dehydratase [Thermaerobacter sp.]|nr:NAD(P)H-hydrate dehydratase [Thermaerobacter sp.]